MPHLRYELDPLRTTLVSPQVQLSTLNPIIGPATVVLFWPVWYLSLIVRIPQSLILKFRKMLLLSGHSCFSVT